MTKTPILVGLFVLLVFAFCPIVNRAQSIGELDNGNFRYHDGCGSPQIWPKGRGRYGGYGVFYVVPNNGGNGAVMKIDGQVVTLRRTKKANYPRSLRRGSKFYESYAGNAYSVRIDYTATRVGVTDHGEWGNYAVTITVTKGKVSKSVSALSSDAC
ncbi:MAG: hypothetical protein IPG58_15710 [Acidobacteria bacterium]|nr:hypothetical protein [Acidobacteriota bacterium]